MTKGYRYNKIQYIQKLFQERKGEYLLRKKQPCVKATKKVCAFLSVE